MASREHSLKSPVWAGREAELLPLCNYQESDSGNLDHLAEFMISSGTEACQALMTLVPEAYNNHPDLVKHYPKVCNCQLAVAGWMLGSGVQEPGARLATRRCICIVCSCCWCGRDRPLGHWACKTYVLCGCRAEPACERRCETSTSTSRACRRAGMARR